MSAPALRPRAVTEILDAAFQLYRAHFRAFALLSAGLMLPLVVIGVAMMLAMMPLMMQTGVAPADFDPTPFLWIYALMPFMYAWMAIVDAGLQVAASDAYLRGEVSASRAARETFRRGWRVIGATFLKYLGLFAVMMIGAVAVGIASAITPILGVPLGIALLVVLPYAFGRLALVPSTCVLEDSGVTRGFGRAIELSKDNGWRVVGGLALAYLVLFVILATVIVGFAVAGMPIAGQVVGQVLWILAYPAVAIVTMLFYYDLRIRKEGFDLEVMSADLARLPEPPAAPFGAGAARRVP